MLFLAAFVLVGKSNYFSGSPCTGCGRRHGSRHPYPIQPQPRSPERLLEHSHHVHSAGVHVGADVGAVIVTVFVSITCFQLGD